MSLEWVAVFIQVLQIEELSKPMPNFKEIYSKRPVTISCELFPPKTEKGMETLIKNVKRLMTFSPDYLTCTYGAGGSDRDRTLQVLRRVKQEFNLPVASHLTLVGSHVDDLRKYLDQAKSAGIDYIVALRGDAPQGESTFAPCDGGLRYANELVDLINAEYQNFDVAVAGYPEVHQEAPSAEVDLENLKRKVDAGAGIVITQLFFDNIDFLRFRDRCRNVGINVPIVPGIMPITNFSQVQRISSLCGAALPHELVSKLEKNESEDAQFNVGVEHAVNQIANLIDEGVEGLHLYVLNKSKATSAILQAIEVSSRIASAS